jgi:hypothetical protein
MNEKDQIHYLYQSISVGKARLIEAIEYHVTQIEYHEPDKEAQLKKLRATIRYLQSLIEVLRSVQQNDLLNEVKATVSFSTLDEDENARIALFGHN